MRVLIGGAAPPLALIRKLDHYGMKVHQGWGLTESSPQATTNQLKSHMLDWPEEKRDAASAKAGIPVPFVDMRVVNEAGRFRADDKPWGKCSCADPGWLPAITTCRKRRTSGRKTAGSAPATSARWTREGYLKIADRTKDLIKSGGEWISSVDLENALVAHPDVREAAVIAVPHPKWQERPLAVVVPREGAQLAPEALREFLGGKFAKWQLPDAFVFVDELPHTSTRETPQDRVAETVPGLGVETVKVRTACRISQFRSAEIQSAR